jgi:hypothetical protein
MRIDPLIAAQNRASVPLRAYLAAAVSYARTGRPSFFDVQALGIVAQLAWQEMMQVALQLPDEGSGQRYGAGQA